MLYPLGTVGTAPPYPVGTAVGVAVAVNAPVGSADVMLAMIDDSWAGDTTALPVAVG